MSEIIAFKNIIFSLKELFARVSSPPENKNEFEAATTCECGKSLRPESSREQSAA
jgi:hypothetical protein